MKFSKTYKAALAFSLAASAIVVSTPTVNAVTFKDVEVLGNSAYELALKDSIYSLANRGVINGYDGNVFKPNNSVTRAEAAVIIASTLNLSSVTVVNPNFKDVKTNAWYYKAVAALANKDIISGYNGNFNPNANITRADMAIILSKAFSLKASSAKMPFKDIPANHYALAQIAALYENKITSGTSSTTFGYNDPVKRGDLAIFVTKSEKLLNPAPVVPDETSATTVTLNAADYGFKSFQGSLFDENGIYKQTATTSTVKFEALKEGQGKVLLKGVSLSTGKAYEAFYLVNIETINNKLHIALEKANKEEYIDYSSSYHDYREVGIGFTPAIYTLKNAKGEIVNDDGNVYLDASGFDLTMYKEGKYTLILENGSRQKTLNVEVTLKNFETKIDVY